MRSLISWENLASPRVTNLNLTISENKSKLSLIIRIIRSILYRPIQGKSILQFIDELESCSFV